MSQKQLKTYKVISSFMEKTITREQAAMLLGISTRQVTRIKKGVAASRDICADKPQDGYTH